MFAGSALEQMLAGLAARPEPARWEQDLRDALGDSNLRLAFWSAPARAQVGVDGAAIDPPYGAAGWFGVDRDGEPVAAILHDPALDEAPELLGAAATATLIWLEMRHLEREVRSARVRVLAAAEEERRRLERDLHDGAQQHLIALRVKLGLAADIGGSDAKRLIAELGDDVDAALDDLRRLAQGIYPPLLRAEGLGSALRSAARRLPLPVTVSAAGIGRHSGEVESAVYHCCLEALQNAAKHAGAGAVATVRLSTSAGSLRFDVEDTGCGFDPGLARTGIGLANMEERMAAVGGYVRVVSKPRHGTAVRGEVRSATADPTTG